MNDAARRDRRAARGAARVRVGPPAAGAARGAAAPRPTPRWRSSRRTRALARMWDGDPTLFSSRRRPRAIDQEPPRLAALAGADARRKSAELDGVRRRDHGGRLHRRRAAGHGRQLAVARGAEPGLARQPRRTCALHVLDNTDPAAVARVDGADRRARRRCSSSRRSRAARSRSRRSSATSGSRRWSAAAATSRARARSFVAITDPATRLGPARRGEALPPRVHQPGRHRRALLGAVVLRAGPGGAARDQRRRAARRRPRSSPPPRARRVPAAESPGAVLGAALGAAAKAGRDKLTLVISPDIASFGSWIEQLVAESTARKARGSSRSTWSRSGRPTSYGDDRLFVYIRFGERRRRSRTRRWRRWSAPGTRSSRIAVGRARGARARVLPLGDRDRDRRRRAGRQPVRRAERHRGEGRDQRAARGARRPRASCRSPEDTCERRATPSGSARTSRRRRRATTSPSARTSCAPPARDAALTRMRAACRDRTRNATTRRLRPALPALDRPAPQGRPEHGRVPAADRRRAPRPAGPGRELHLRDAARRAGAGRPAGAASGAAAARCASTSAPTSTPRSTRSPTRWTPAPAASTAPTVTAASRASA